MLAQAGQAYRRARDRGEEPAVEPALRDELYRELEAKGHLQDAREAFARLARTDASEKVFDPDSFWRLGGAKELSPRSRAVLKELYFFREKTSSDLDKAPFRVLPEPLMVRLAHKLPETSDALERCDGMTPYLFRKFGRELMEAICKGLAAPPIADPPERPRQPALDHATVSRYLVLKEWRKNKAAEKGVDPVVVLPTDDLRKLSAAPGQGGSPSEWITFLSDRKRELYGEELVRILSTPPPAPPAGGGRRRRRRR